PLIVDTKNDLNVYLTAGEDGTSCCGTGAEKASSCCNVEMQVRCCKPEQKESCCQSSSSTCGCQDKTSMASDAKKLAASPVQPHAVARTRLRWQVMPKRWQLHWLVPSLCRQAYDQLRHESPDLRS
ncbi:hypothetical protein V490_00023, partial [Pseudogymnoascus sp. VKM F-3557]